MTRSDRCSRTPLAAPTARLALQRSPAHLLAYARLLGSARAENGRGRSGIGLSEKLHDRLKEGKVVAAKERKGLHLEKCKRQGRKRTTSGEVEKAKGRNGAALGEVKKARKGKGAALGEVEKAMGESDCTCGSGKGMGEEGGCTWGSEKDKGEECTALGEVKRQARGRGMHLGKGEEGGCT